jgi:hypothetical protein
MTARTTTWTARVGLGLALAAAGAPALAQDPPARVGRIAYLSGPVSFSPAGAADWSQAPLNRPLVAGDRLWTDAGARDEAQFGSAIARMDAGTLLTVLGADDRTTQLQVSQGRVDLHVRRLLEGETVEVDTPNLAFVARAPGDYRLVVAPDGSTTDVAVLRGGGDVYGDGTSLALAPGQAYRFGGQDLNNYVVLPPAPPDDFDRWAFGRDQRFERAVARRYVPQGVVGAEDLDDYGSWRAVPEYGTVWVPDRAPRGWAPYHAGHWSWIDPWGWTWIDDQPYGYAVSHYGRWIRTPDTWAWVPTPVESRPVYAPALVAFVGTVLTIGGRSDPGVGWFPLAPHEPYRPPYRASPTYIANVNVSNTVIRQTNVVNIVNNVTNIRYVNRNVPGAMVAMTAPQFARAVPTARAGLVLPPGVARAAPVLAAPQARPLAHNMVGTPAGRLPPAPVMQRVAVTRALPPAAFVHGGATVAGPHPGAGGPGRHGPQLAAHGPVPPLRVLRPAVGQPMTPQPARGPVPGADPGGRRFAQEGRPGMAPVARGPQGVAGMPPAGAPLPLPGHPVHGVAPLAGTMNGQRDAHPVRPGAAPAPLAGPALPAAARGPHDAAHPAAHGGVTVAPWDRPTAGFVSRPGAPDAPRPGPAAPQPGAHGQGPRPGPRPLEGAGGLAQHAPAALPPAVAAQQNGRALVAQGQAPVPRGAMPHAQAGGAMPRPDAHDGVSQRGNRHDAPRIAAAVAPVASPPHAAAPRSDDRRQGPRPAPHDGQAPQRVAMPAPQPAPHVPAQHAQPAAHGAPQPAPHPQPVAHPQTPQPASHAPAPHPQPAPRPPAPQPAPPAPPHPSPAHEAPHPHAAPPAAAAPGHGADKGGDHGRKHGEQGGH